MPNHLNTFTQLHQLDYPTQLTGDQRSPLSRTKDNADHAGLSQLSELWKEKPQFTDKAYKALLNNNWLIAQEAMETTDAAVDGWITDSNSSRITVSPLKISTHTELLTKLANSQEETSRSLNSLMSQPVTLTPWPLPAFNNPSLLP